MRDSSNDDSEYYDAMLDVLEWVWGRDYMAPGGEGNVESLPEKLPQLFMALTK
jgi:hypothetical protein